ncbi:MAG: hypothetical protein ACI906_003783 [Candidatus Latescibacterota bacterium]
MEINGLAVLLVILNIICAIASNSDVRDQRRKLEAMLAHVESLRTKLQEVLQRGKVVRSTRTMLTRLRETKEEELLSLQKELEAFEEHAQNEAENAEGDEGNEGRQGEEEHEEEHHDKEIGLSKGVAGQRGEELAFKKLKKNVRSKKKSSDR